jgi:hypothetical protein
MGKETIINNLEEMKIPQAVLWLDDIFKKYDLNEKESIFFKDVKNVILREHSKLNKESIRWNIVKESLTKAQTTKLIEEL